MLRAALALVMLTLVACASDVTVEDGTDTDAHDGLDEEHVEHDVFLRDPDLPDRFLFAGNQTVGQVARTACSTAGVRPLSEQLLAEVECLRPGTLSRIDNIANVSLGAGALPKLNSAAATALRNTVAGGGTMNISSSTRATAQQYVLYYWYANGRCTSVVSLAAKPGRSNHESGVAIDVPAHTTWRSKLTARGFAWLGSSDPVHFDFRGSGAVDIRPLAVKAFQRLWNRNHPGDRIAEDGAWGPATSSRMDRAPAGGFAIGPQCGVTPPTTATLEGVIYEGASTSAVIGGATVSLSNGRSATTSAAGRYQIANLAPGTYTISVTAAGFRAASRSATVAIGADNTANVSLTRGGATGSLIGVIYRGTDTTARIAGATVRLGTGQSATADASGVYRFSAVGEGAVTITASAPGYLAKTITRTVAPSTENWGSVGLSQGQALESQCGGVSVAGECDGNVVAYCQDGELVTVDCGAHGLTCGWNGDEGYNDCR